MACGLAIPQQFRGATGARARHTAPGVTPAVLGVPAACTDPVGPLLRRRGDRQIHVTPALETFPQPLLPGRYLNSDVLARRLRRSRTRVVGSPISRPRLPSHHQPGELAFR